MLYLKFLNYIFLSMFGSILHLATEEIK